MLALNNLTKLLKLVKTKKKYSENKLLRYSNYYY